MKRIIIEGGYVATVNDQNDEFETGYIVIDDDLIVAVGAGGVPDSVSSPAEDITVEYIDASGTLVTPGLINTHHHLYQWLTRGYAQDSILFDWLVALYPTWSRITEEGVEAAAEGAMAVLAKTGCTTVADHHYIFPSGSGDLLGGIVRAGATLGVRLNATRGSMDLGRSDGGLPPDFAVETTSAALSASAEAVNRFHDPSFGAMTQVSIAPCSPFSVTTDLLREAAVLSRDLGVRMHTHGSETVEEEAFCLERFGKGPTDYLESVGWLGSDVWMAHCVHLNDADIAAFARTGTGVAHCPSSNARLAAGIAPVAKMLAANVPVGLGVDGAASNESGQLGTEIRQSVLMNRLRSGAESFSVRDGLYVATRGGARVLGREHEIGSLEPGKCADVVLWEISGVEHAGIADPVAAIGLGGVTPPRAVFVNGERIVGNGELLTVDEREIAQRVASASRKLFES